MLATMINTLCVFLKLSRHLRSTSAGAKRHWRLAPPRSRVNTDFGSLLRVNVAKAEPAFLRVPLLLKILPASPEVLFLQIQIFIVCFLQNHLFIGKLQKMVSLMVLIVPRVNKILLTLWFAVIAVRHHQIPVDILCYGIFWHIKCILTLPYIFNYRCLYASFFQNFSGRRIFVLLSGFHSSFRQDPALVLVLVTFVQQQDLSTKY